MKPEAEVVVVNPENVSNEVLADAIVKLSDASARLLKSGLTRRAICVLLKDLTQIPMSQTLPILDALPKLAETYTIPKKAALKNGKR